MYFNYGETLFAWDSSCDEREMFLLQQENQRLLEDIKAVTFVRIAVNWR